MKAWDYYFNYIAETACAGSHNFTALTFGASPDNGDVGAEGRAAWLFKEDISNTVTAYFLQNMRRYFRLGGEKL